jgi:hypothetical protein
LDWLDPALEERKHYGCSGHPYLFVSYYDS